jgi:hypothetical protein
MSLEDLGNIGEFVAAVAVVLSLIYLAVQIRQNTRQIDENTASLRVMSADETLRSFSHYRDHIIRDPDIADLYLRGARSLRDLDTRDRLRFTQLASELFHTYQGVYRRSRSLDESELWEYVAGTGTLLPVLRQPGIREWWSGAKEEFTEGFVSEIESLLRRIEEAEGDGVKS